MTYLQLAVAVLVASASVALVRIAIRVMLFDRIEYQKSRARYPSFLHALTGKATVRRSELPDGRVRAGIVYNVRAQRIEPNGKLRNDVVDQVA